MIPDRPKFVWSDAWLLLSIIYAKGWATRSKIKEIGGFINFAEFTNEEFEGGLERLMDAGYVIERDGKYNVTQPVLDAYARTTTPRRGMQTEVDDMKAFLGVE